MNPPSKDLAEYLETSSAATGLVLGVDLDYSEEPAEPDAFVTLYDTGGEPPQAGFKHDKPFVQARIRSPRQDYGAGYATAEKVKDALHELANITINATKYIGIWATGDIMKLKKDENDRTVFVISFRIHRTI